MSHMGAHRSPPLPALRLPSLGPIPLTSPTYVTIVPAEHISQTLDIPLGQCIVSGLCYHLILINDIESIVGGGTMLPISIIVR